MAHLAPLLLLALGSCDDSGSQPPCSAFIVIGTVTFDCDTAALAAKRKGAPPPAPGPAN